MIYRVNLHFWDIEHKQVVNSAMINFDNLMDAVTYAQQTADGFYGIGHVDIDLEWKEK